MLSIAGMVRVRFPTGAGIEWWGYQADIDALCQSLPVPLHPPIAAINRLANGRGDEQDIELLVRWLLENAMIGADKLKCWLSRLVVEITCDEQGILRMQHTSAFVLMTSGDESRLTNHDRQLAGLLG
jgi:hypothetical protein